MLWHMRAPGVSVMQMEALSQEDPAASSQCPSHGQSTASVLITSTGTDKLGERGDSFILYDNTAFLIYKI